MHANRARARVCVCVCAHVQEAEAFKLDVGGFDALEEVANDVAATSASWNRYAEFLAERNEMANRDWLSMRDQVR